MGTPAQFIEQSMNSAYDQAHDRKQQRKDMLTDEEHAIKRDDLLREKDNLQQQLAAYKDANGEIAPQYKDQYDKAMAALAKNQYDIGQLYDPIKAPGRLQQDWHYLRERVHGIKNPNTPVAQERIDTSTQPAVTATTLPGMHGEPLTIPGDGTTPDVTLNASPVPLSTSALPAITQTQIVPLATPVNAPMTWKDRGSYQSPAELKQKAEAMQKAQQNAESLAAASALSPAQVQLSQFRAEEAVRQAQIAATLSTATSLGVTGPALDELKEQLVGLKTVVPKSLPGEAGKPYKGEDGLWYRSILNPDGSLGRQPMPPDWKPSPIRATKGALINTKKYGWIITYVDPTNPSKIVGWQKTTPSRYYQGTTTTGSSTDPFGVTTSSTHTTKPTETNPIDVDLSGAEEMPSDVDGGNVSASTPTTTSQTYPSPSSDNNGPINVSPHARPKELKKSIPAPPSQGGNSQEVKYQLDQDGHIPDEDIKKRGLNSYLVQVANNILDGADVSKISLKDRGAAEELAKKYGWGGQGLFTPKEKLLLKESATYLDKAMNDPSMKVLDSKASRIKIANALHAAQDNAGMLSKALSIQLGLTPQENNFVSTYLQLIGTISGLGQLTRGGRMTEATAKRLMNELPAPLLTPSSAAGIDKLKRLRSEIDVATQKGSFDLNSKPSSGGLSLDEFKQKYKLP